MDILIRKYIGLSQAEIDRLPDEEYIDKAAQTTALIEHDIEKIKNGILMALDEIAQNINAS
ncbi:MAG: hypothetical protein PWQ93_1422 [Clostridiales bacterium]|jgi:hypothetical protein|nr:hypothetical protein [Clostridiales bacterium]